LITYININPKPQVLQKPPPTGRNSRMRFSIRKAFSAECKNWRWQCPEVWTKKMAQIQGYW